MDKKQVIRMANFLFWNFLSSLLVMGSVMRAVDGSSKYPALRLVGTFMIYMIMTVSLGSQFVSHSIIDVAESGKLPKVKITVKKPQDN